MLLCDETIWAIPDGASGIEFTNPEEGQFFLEAFEKTWETAVEAVAAEHDDCLRDNPASVSDDSDKFFVSFVPLDIPYMDGAFCDTWRGPEALDKAIEALKEKYPDAEYNGCIQYAWSDEHGGDVVKYEVSSRPNGEPYPFVGEILKEAVEDEDEYFWDQIEDSDELDEIAEDLETYKDWVGEEALERIAEMKEEE